jgi:hypothetical protein
MRKISCSKKTDPLDAPPFLKVRKIKFLAGSLAMFRVDMQIGDDFHGGNSKEGAF